jgi:hypothetical protein
MQNLLPDIAKLDIKVLVHWILNLSWNISAIYK